MSTDQTTLSVSRTIDAPADAIFQVLTLPSRHREFDGSGMVRSDDYADRIQQVGDTFVMNMHAESQGGDYQMRNYVTAYAENLMVGWQPNSPDADGPGGWEWLYELKSQGSDSTEVTLTYDWSKVEDPKLASVFPVLTESSLEESFNLLAAAVSDA
ncbi:SRPBCC domain-containing protein [Georgenia sp. Z1491]|uniref:SRPBCC domain-containing protein n=1 Tax=Georgenia sp. Z1491 TaxID=3416707 RepID=UPI003CE79A89